MSTRFEIKQEELMRASALFTKGPWVILVACLMVCVLVLVSSYGRIQQNRIAEYEKVFSGVSSVARSASVAIANYESRVVERSLKFIQASMSGKSNGRTDDFAFIRPTAPIDHLVQGGEPFLSHLRAFKTSGETWKIVELDDSTILHLHSVDYLGKTYYTALRAARADFTRALGDSVASWAGELELSTASGTVIAFAQSTGTSVNIEFDKTAASTESVDNTLSATSTTRHPGRRLTQKVQTGVSKLQVKFSIDEASALSEFDIRTDAAWRVIGLSLAAWLTLGCFVVLALFKFKRVEAYLRSVATADILTGLPNRRSFSALLNRSLRAVDEGQVQSIALIFIDIDNFKVVNDTAGHPAGDQMLMFVASQLRKLENTSTRISRLAGDEFTVLVEGDFDEKAAQKLGEAAVDIVQGYFEFEGQTFEVRASAGVALYPRHACSAQEVMQFADTALYRAKDSGRGRCVVYSPSMTAEDAQRLQLIRDLRDATLSDGGLYLQYQPKFHLSSGTLTGYEALIRWNHPSRGILSPALFIPVAESSGVIADLGIWVLNEACKQIKAWRDQGFGWRKIAVNVSPLQLSDVSFPAKIGEILAAHGVPAYCLQVEITESAIAQNPTLAVDIVTSLRKMGVQVSLDDFGTGFSSLSMLADFEIDTLKIDRSFVNQLHTSRGISICTSIVTLGRSIGAAVLAEGVETENQARLLAQIGCDEVQGFLYARPLPAGKAVSTTSIEPVIPQNSSQLGTCDRVALHSRG